MKILARILWHTNKRFIRCKSTLRDSSEDYCIYLVRKHDYENYLCALLLPQDHQRRAFALRAFNIEIANIENQAKEPSIIQMRLKFWENAIDEIFSDKPPNHPVAIEVHKVLAKTAIVKKCMHRLVEGRAQKFTSSSFQNIKQMEIYAENTMSSLYYLLMISCGVTDVNADHAFSHMGKGQGLTNLIRSIPYYAQRRAIVLPQDSLVKHKISHEAVFRGSCNDAMQDAVFEVASLAHSHLGKARSLIMLVPSSIRKHFLPIVPSSGFLERLRLVEFDIFHPSLQLRDHKLPFKLLWYRLIGL